MFLVQTYVSPYENRPARRFMLIPPPPPLSLSLPKKKITSQRLAPVWSEMTAIYLTTWDFAFLTPTALIRFNKVNHDYSFGEWRFALSL